MRRYIVLFIICLLFLAGCSSKQKSEVKEVENQTDSSEMQEKETDGEQKGIDENPTKGEEAAQFFKDVPPIPKTASDLILQSPGKFADQEVLSDEVETKVIEEIKDMPVLAEDASEEAYDQYFQYVYSQVATDFPNPDDLINKWEFSMSGDPNLPDSRFHFKENYNIEVILDASGSMKEVISGKSMMEHAKDAIKAFLANVPEDANVSLRVYGHKGTGSQADKQLSCTSIEQVYGFSTYEQGAFDEALNRFQPSGWTPIAAALEEAKKGLEPFDAKTNTNLIYLVSDGVETCDGDPVAVAKSFSESNIAPIINVIGFNVDSEAQRQLKEVAKISNGTYTTVTNGEELEEEFKRADEVLERWREWKDQLVDDADAQRVEQNFDILEYSNDWGSRATQQFINISSFLSIMYDEGKIDINQMDELNKRRDQIDELVNETQKEMTSDLENLNIEKVEELKKQIEEKYQSNI
ncbi:VWA domain-containing protein [Bacillus sp. FJAT-50079]|uniref:VWA domain-containing protein n=1 Tax=Bacillus sp. FJAT-50079 TaxID=2833577 RepID=UPI001BC9074A|nr:VWA domain-containing protein [Bacillus sp. FJAT-50079]MBS4210377.1 VWA domain-containing protein [Bacillus sp. FJAT-50079]